MKKSCKCRIRTVYWCLVLNYILLLSVICFCLLCILPKCRWKIYCSANKYSSKVYLYLVGCVFEIQMLLLDFLVFLPTSTKNRITEKLDPNKPYPRSKPQLQRILLVKENTDLTYFDRFLLEQIMKRVKCQRQKLQNLALTFIASTYIAPPYRSEHFQKCCSDSFQIAFIPI